jgi:hypothetical protein
MPGTVKNYDIKTAGLVKMHLPQGVNLIALEWLENLNVKAGPSQGHPAHCYTVDG